MADDKNNIESGFREAMRALASSVTVVSTVDPETGQKHAMTATAVTSLCMDPAALLICINEQTTMHGLLNKGNAFCVNILFSDQEDISNACSGKLKGEERFTIGNWATDESGMVYLQDAQANIFCSNEQAVNYGTHKIFIGKVSEVYVRNEVSPLVYVAGSYATAETR